ncbi:MAG: VOC family protein [Chloroflexi bacterium]|nr:VOC family protein [Chloroflexota bacterium]
MTITEIHHVQITIPVGAEAEARAFYSGLLGLPEIAKPASLAGRGGLWLLVGGRELHVSTETADYRHATKAHVAYLVEDLAGWREKLGRAGITIAESIPIPGYHRLEFRDPFGNRVELIERE